MLQVLISNKDATQVSFSKVKGASITTPYTSPSIVTPSVNGQKYIISLWVKNTGPGIIGISSTLPGSATISVLPNSKFTYVTLNVTGDGSTNLSVVISSVDTNAFTSLMVLLKVNRSSNPLENLATSISNFVGWTFSALNVNVTTLTNQTRTFDYTQYVNSGSLTITDKLNQPAQCTFSLTNNDNSFVIPSREAYVQVFSNQYNRFVFTGFIANDIPKDFVGLNSNTPSMNFQTYRFLIQATGDEYLLGQKAVPILPPFVNMGAGQILAYLSNVLAPGFFDVSSQVASGDLVPYLEYDPNKNWITLAKELADQFRYRVKILNKVLYYKPWGDQVFPITYDDTLNQKTFDPSLLKTTIFDTPLVNDVFVLGDVEASDNHEDYFVGDGFTSNFPLRYTGFQTDTDLLLKEDWSSGSIDTSKWVLQDPVNSISLVGSLNINGGTNNFGETFQYLRTGIDLGRKTILEHGEIFFVGNCSGAIIGGIYDNANTFAEVSASGQCEFGFDIRPASGFSVAVSVSGVSGLQIQPRRLGQLFGTPVITQQNHYYILRTIVNGKSQNRYTSTFKSFTGAIVSGGSNNAVADITWVISDINLNNTNPNQPGFVNIQPPITDTRFTLRDQVIPAFGLYVLYNVRNANLTIQWTQIFDPPQATLSAAGLSGVSGGQLPLLPTKVGVPLDYELGFGLGRQVATIGNSQAGGGGSASDGTGSVLQFYSDSIPGVGSRIRLQSWEAKTALARVQDSNSIALESLIVGDDGHRMALLTDFKPLPRSSEECELAGKAVLLDRTNTIYQGSYGPIRDIFFDFSQNFLLFSEQFDQPSWSLSNITVTPNSTTNSFGQQLADKISVTANGVALIRQVVTGVGSATGNTYSVFVKKNTGANVGNTFVLRNETTSTNLLEVSINYDTGVLTQLIGNGGSVVNAGNSWYRITLTATSGISNGDSIACYVGFIGGSQNAGDSIFAWGAQLEKNDGTAGYITTTSSAIDHDYPRPGLFFTINSPRRNINNLQVMVSSVKIDYIELMSEQANFTVNYGPTQFLENLLATFVPKPTGVLMSKDTAAQPTPIQLANVTQAFTGDLDLVRLTGGPVPGLGFDGSNAYFDIGAIPVTAVEVRRTNFGWGKNNNDRLGIFTTRTFTMPRTQFDQTWYLRQINGPLISRRSKVVRVFAPIVPSTPTATIDLSDPMFPVISVNFNGDIRNIFGIEIRLADNVTIAPLKAGTFQSGIGSQNIAQRVFTTPTDLVFTIDNSSSLFYNMRFFVYFFNLMWEYSSPFILDVTIANVTPAGSLGQNVVTNPGFELQTFSYQTNGIGQVNKQTGNNQLIADGWYAATDLNSGFLVDGIETSGAFIRTGSLAGFIGLPHNQVITNGTRVVGSLTFPSTRGKVKTEGIPVRGGDNYYFGGYARWDANASFPAGITGKIQFLLEFFDSNGVSITAATGIFSSTPNAGWIYLDGLSPVPANASFALITCRGEFTNNSGSSFNSVGNNYFDVRFDDVFVEIANRTTHATYRPLSNPLTAHDAGSSVTINIASFTMRSGSTDVVVNSGSVIALNYLTLYYVYYDDPDFIGGTRTFNATATKEIAILGENRFFVGSIATPKATAPDTSGNGDGGSGAQIGQVVRLQMGSYTPGTTSGTGAITSPEQAFDGDFTTSARLQVPSVPGQISALYAAPPGITTRFKSLVVNFDYQIVTNSTNGSGGITFNVRNFITLASYGSFNFSEGAGPVGRTTTTVSVPFGVNPAQLQLVIAIQTIGASSGSIDVKVFEVWIEGVE